MVLDPAAGALCTSRRTAALDGTGGEETDEDGEADSGQGSEGGAGHNDGAASESGSDGAAKKPLVSRGAQFACVPGARLFMTGWTQRNMLRPSRSGSLCPGRHAAHCTVTPAYQWRNQRAPCGHAIMQSCNQRAPCGPCTAVAQLS